MTDNAVQPLSVSIQQLSPIRVAAIDCMPGAGDMDSTIRAAFGRLQSWVRERGGDPQTLLHVGVVHTAGGQLSSYTSCVQVPGFVQAGSAGVNVEELAGGRFAVLTIVKDPAIIGESIRRFYQEAVPALKLDLDPARSTYEIYYERTMEYCVPVL